MKNPNVVRAPIDLQVTFILYM